MPEIPFPASSTPGRRPGEGEGRIVNCYATKEGERAYYRRVPGLAPFVATGQAGPRGMIDVDGVLYAAFAGVVVRVAGGVVTTLAGALPGSDGVTFARNNRVTNGVSTPDIVAVREGGGAYLITSTTVSAYPDADVPATVNSVAFMGGYFVFSVPDGRVFASDLNTTVTQALSFSTAEAKPDGLRRVLAMPGRIYALGEASIEVFLNVGASPFPMRPAPSSMAVGLLTTMAIAGDETGWGRSPYFVAADGTVRALSGFELTAPVSTPDVEAFIAVSAVATLEASVFTIAGRAFWVLSSDRGTWVLDVASGSWHERVSTGLTRWRGSRSVLSGGRWIVGDRLTGALLAVDDTVRTEAGAAMPFTAESGPMKAYPARILVPAAFADFTEADADVAVSWSHDGGKTWSAPLTRSLSRAEREPVRVNRLGLTTHHGLRMRLTSSSAADFSFMGASVPDPQGRRP